MDAHAIAPFEIASNASEASVRAELARVAPNGTVAAVLADRLSASQFTCRKAATKLVCRKQRRVNAFQTEVWILAFDLDDKGRIIDRRVQKGYIAP